ncbi:MAG TPA: YdeI/OmpD-associated family protein [Candidatus Udaeobacter sp.]|nr:YdeI/OmpD-associated family protein [Candidatus Udaeobacter sp.]
MNPEFFQTPADFRTWLEKNHATATELWVGFYKKDSGKPSITWPESVGQALCFGWIDGIRKRVDEISYQIRFTPRRHGSIWSATNIKRAKELASQKQMRPAGLEAFAARIENKSGIYSYEQRSAELQQPYAKLLKKNEAAWKFFEEQPRSYRKMIGWWIVSAKKEETRMARLAKLISESAKGKRLLE